MNLPNQPAMSSAGFARLALMDPEWLAAWGALDNDFKGKLKSAGLSDPRVWAKLRDDRDRMLNLLNAVGAVSSDPNRFTCELDWCMALRRAAQSAGADWSDQIAGQSDTQRSLEMDLSHGKGSKLPSRQVFKQW